MKKALSIILALIMITAVFALPASAADSVLVTDTICDCEDHVKTGKCTCCLYCENLDRTYKTPCAVQLEDGTYTVCCIDCDGIFPCDCNCDCCPKDSESNPENTDKPPLISEENQEVIVGGWNEIMQKVVAFFEEFFNYIFEFLKLADIMPEA